MYSKLLSRIIRLIEYILMVLLGVALIIITLQVFFRYILHNPLSWSEQTARCLFIWMIMLAVPVLFYRKGAVAFDLLVDMLPRRAQDIAKFLCSFSSSALPCFISSAAPSFASRQDPVSSAALRSP